jgi:hypothetical protein
MTDNALAHCKFLVNLHGSDTGKGWMEHRSFLWETGQKSFCRDNGTCVSPNRLGGLESDPHRKILSNSKVVFGFRIVYSGSLFFRTFMT